MKEQYSAFAGTDSNVELLYCQDESESELVQSCTQATCLVSEGLKSNAQNHKKITHHENIFK